MAVISQRDDEDKMPDSKASLRYALEAIDRIESYVQGLSYTEFRRNRMCQDAVIFRFEILGHILADLLRGWKDQRSVEALARYAALCIEIGRDYTGVNPSPIWEALTVALPRLKKELLGLRTGVKR